MIGVIRCTYSVTSFSVVLMGMNNEMIDHQLFLKSCGGNIKVHYPKFCHVLWFDELDS